MANQVVYEDLESGTPSTSELEGAPAGAEAPAGAAPTKEAPAAKEDKQAAKDAAALQARIRELEQESRFWAEKAKANPTQETKPKADDGPDELEQLLANAGVDEGTAAELLDELGEKGVQALQKRGVVTMDQLKQILGAAMRKMETKASAIAESRVDGAKTQLSAEAKLLKDFPDLADEKSDFAKETAKHFAEMVAEDPSLKNSYVALRAAARLASQKQAPSGKDGDSPLTSRMQRIASQSPARGGRPVNEFDDDDVEITPEARTILAHAAKYGVTEESYRRNARRSN